MFDYLDDRKIDDGTGDSSEKWGYTDDDYLRTNRDRYWFRMKHDQGDLPLGFFGKVDLDIVSDQDYLREFKEGIAGFNASDNYFFRNFGRDLGDYDDTIRRNIVNLTRNWQFRYTASFDLVAGQAIRQQYSLHRDLHCWRFEFNRTISAVDSQFGFRIYLKSIPSLKFARGREDYMGSVGGAIGGGVF